MIRTQDRQNKHTLWSTTMPLETHLPGFGAGCKEAWGPHPGLRERGRGPGTESPRALPRNHGTPTKPRGRRTSVDPPEAPLPACLGLPGLRERRWGEGCAQTLPRERGGDGGRPARKSCMGPLGSVWPCKGPLSTQTKNYRRVGPLPRAASALSRKEGTPGGAREATAAGGSWSWEFLPGAKLSLPGLLLVLPGLLGHPDPASPSLPDSPPLPGRLPASAQLSPLLCRRDTPLPGCRGGCGFPVFFLPHFEKGEIFAPLQEPPKIQHAAFVHHSSLSRLPRQPGPGAKKQQCPSADVGALSPLGAPSWPV